MTRKLLELVLELTQRLQADNSIRVDLSDIISDLEFQITLDNMGDEE